MKWKKEIDMKKSTLLMTVLFFTWILASCGSMNVDETAKYFCTSGPGTASAEVIQLQAQQEIFDNQRMSASVAAPAIDVSGFLNPLSVNYCQQATSIQGEIESLRKINPDASTKDQQDRAVTLTKGWNEAIKQVTNMLEQATKAMTAYQTAVLKTVYNDAQSASFNECVSYLEAGNWKDAEKACKKSSDLAIPPSPTPTETLTPTITPIPSETPIPSVTPIPSETQVGFAPTVDPNGLTPCYNCVLITVTPTYGGP